jgi:hypothetical protein
MSSSKAAKSKITERRFNISECALPLSPSLIISGEVAILTSDGKIFVDFAQNSLGPLAARTLVEDLYLGVKVLLAFDGGDPTRPIILGIIRDQIQKAGRTIHLKADRIVLEAKSELSLTCGEGAFEARPDGKVSVKGRDVVSRATRTNRVRGATVMIN